MENKKILIVEDEMIIALLIERMVNDLGYEVIAKVVSGEEAVMAATEYNPDIILMDIRLQGEIDGIEAVSRIRKTRSIPIIYISGNTDKLHQDKIEKSERIDFLSKPITLSDLSRSLKRVAS
ncbi:MAG TPA: response regulator [Balneolaceae bacterium]